MKYVKLCSFFFNYLNFLYLKIVILFTSLTKNDDYIGTKIKFFFSFQFIWLNMQEIIVHMQNTFFMHHLYMCRYPKIYVFNKSIHKKNIKKKT